MDKNVLVLAYLGDSIYETYIRLYLIEKGICKVKELQEKSIKYVSAKAQSSFLKQIIDNNMLNIDELDIVTKARNHKNNHKPKNTDIITYKHATALEALIGYLYYKNDYEKIKQIMDYITGGKIC
ncbi:MAG: ribonuclease III domain-containing protein [bacterium]|nr:ribonuclease III domain-containing protein [bacterium]